MNRLKLATSFLFGIFAGSLMMLLISNHESIDDPTLHETLALLEAREAVSPPNQSSSKDKTVKEQWYSVKDSDDPMFREQLAMSFALDYSEFISQRVFDRNKAIMLCELLTLQFFPGKDESGDDYEILIANLLGPQGYEEFVDYREELPRQKSAVRILQEFVSKYPATEESEMLAIRETAENFRFEHDLTKRLFRNQPIDFDKERIFLESSYTNEIDRLFKRNKLDLTIEQKEALKQLMLEKSEYRMDLLKLNALERKRNG